MVSAMTTPILIKRNKLATEAKIDCALCTNVVHGRI